MKNEKSTAKTTIKKITAAEDGLKIKLEDILSS